MSATEWNEGIAQAASGESRPAQGLQGRALDALVAEKVFGWTILSTEDMTAEAVKVWEQQPHCLHFMRGFNAWRDEDGIHVRQQFPHFSTEIAAAWRVVEKLNADGWRVEVDMEPGVGPEQCACAVVSRGNDSVDFVPKCGSTFPLAICLAALKVKA